jgi:hypothetical protein
MYSIHLRRPQSYIWDMLNFRFSGTRRSRAAWPFVAVIVLFAVSQYALRDLRHSSLSNEVWEGRLVRAYKHRELRRRQPGPERPWWEVKTTEGRYRSIDVGSWEQWQQGRPGDWVVKRAGRLGPELFYP